MIMALVWFIKKIWSTDKLPLQVDLALVEVQTE